MREITSEDLGLLDPEERRLCGLLRDAIRLIIGRKTNVPWREVPDSEVDAYEKEIAALKGESHG